MPSARRRGYTVEGTWRLDPLGFTGAKLDLELLIERSRLEDPVTGIVRSFDGTRTKQIELDFRHDVPRSDLAWGAEFRRTRFAPDIRVAEHGFDYANPTFGAVFVEHKDVFGLTVRVRAANLFRGDTVLDRLVYAGPRYSAPLLFRENKRRELGKLFTLYVSGSF